jgi:hypothetical protein
MPMDLRGLRLLRLRFFGRKFRKIDHCGRYRNATFTRQRVGNRIATGSIGRSLNFLLCDNGRKRARYQQAGKQSNHKLSSNRAFQDRIGTQQFFKAPICA